MGVLRGGIPKRLVAVAPMADARTYSEVPRSRAPYFMDHLDVVGLWVMIVEVWIRRDACPRNG